MCGHRYYSYVCVLISGNLFICMGMNLRGGPGHAHDKYSARLF